MQDTTYTKTITSEHVWFRLNLKEVWRYRDLIWLFTRKAFVVTYKQTILGPAWVFLNPLIGALMYAFVFGMIAGIDTEGVPRLLFYLCSNALWIFFSTSLSQNAAAFTANAHIFGKVYFPRLTIPVSNVLTAAIQLGVQMILVALSLIYYVVKGAVQPNWAACLLIPAVVVHLGLLALGCGIIISSLTTKYRDLSILVNFGIQLWMYASPIVYPVSELTQGWMRTVLRLNPVTAPVELFRFCLLGVGTLDWGGYALSLGMTLVIALAGILIFNRVEKTFLDTV